MTNILRLFGKKEFLSCLGTQLKPQEYFMGQFCNIFDLHDIPDLNEKYLATFDKFRDNTAIITYTTSLSIRSHYQLVLKALKEYVRDVLLGTFYINRYNPEQSIHTRKVFASDKIKELWVSKAEMKTLDISDNQEPQEVDYREFLTQKILRDTHIDPLLLPRLTAFLNQGVVSIVDMNDPFNEFQNLAIQLCTNKIHVEIFVEKVKKIHEIPYVFQNDLKALVPEHGFGNFQVTETDDPCDLLLIGTEIHGSCQNVRSGSEALVSYMMNGELKAVVVKRNDILVARSVIRLMWDEKNQAQVILMERIYSNIKHKKIDDALIEWAEDKSPNYGAFLGC